MPAVPPLTVAAVAARLGVSADTVLDLIHAGELVARKLRPAAVRPTYLIAEEDFAAYWEAARAIPRSATSTRRGRPRQLPEVATATRYYR